VKAPCLVFGIGHRGQKDHRDVSGAGGGLELAAHLVAVHIRHHDVQKDQVRTGLADNLQRALPVLGDQQLVAKPSQGFTQHLQVGGVVVDQ